VASLLLGLVLMATGLGVGRVGVDNIIANNYATLAIPKLIALAASVVSILGKEAMFWYTRYYAKLINSSAFMA
ncbi:cation transporter, partial [Eggerthella lenta]|nr:cation transporter [Eggerthella lenta]